MAKQRQTWNEIEPSIWAMAFSNAAARAHCTHCLSVDHFSEQCRTELNVTPERVASRQSASASPRGHAEHQICLRWNNQGCVSPSCTYLHFCLSCWSSDHRVGECRKGGTPFKPGRAYGYLPRHAPYPNYRGNGQRRGQGSFRSRSPPRPPI